MYIATNRCAVLVNCARSSAGSSTWTSPPSLRNSECACSIDSIGITALTQPAHRAGPRSTAPPERPAPPTDSPRRGPSLGPAVWEIGAVAYEHQAWTRYLYSTRGEAAKLSYLADHFNGEVSGA
jgi:hypothetical protein